VTFSHTKERCFYWTGGKGAACPRHPRAALWLTAATATDAWAISDWTGLGVWMWLPPSFAPSLSKRDNDTE